MNGRAALESVSFLTEDWALSWNASCLSAASASFSGAATFSSLEQRVESEIYVTGGRLGVTWRDEKDLGSCCCLLKGITI